MDMTFQAIQGLLLQARYGLATDNLNPGIGARNGMLAIVDQFSTSLVVGSNTESLAGRC